MNVGTRAGITIRERRPEDDESIVAIYGMVHADRPPMTVEELRHRSLNRPDRANSRLIVAERENEVIGYAGWNRLIYVQADSNWWVFGIVHPAHRGRGIGKALYEAALRDVDAHGAEKLTCQVRENEDRGLRFVRERGFEPTGHVTRLARLDVKRANVEKARTAAQRAQRDGFRIATLAELGSDDESLLRRLHEVDNEASRDEPGSETWSFMPYDEWHQELFETPGSSPETIWPWTASASPATSG